MLRFRCPQCDEMLETDRAPGSPEKCPACGRQVVVPEPKPSRLARWREERRAKREARRQEREAARAAAQDGPTVGAAPFPADPAPLEPARTGIPEYGAVRTLASVLRIVGVVCWAVAFFFAIAAVSRLSGTGSSYLGSILGGIGVVCGAFLLLGLFYVAMGELLLCIRDMAINSHRIAEATERDRL
jgi:rRNA maturation protein Nop10